MMLTVIQGSGSLCEYAFPTPNVSYYCSGLLFGSSDTNWLPGLTRECWIKCLLKYLQVKNVEFSVFEVQVSPVDDFSLLFLIYDKML